MRGRHQEFLRFLRKNERSVASELDIHVILDNYIIHKSRYTLDALEAMNGRLHLHFLPPYSPEHNRIEGLWKQLHDNVTRNHRHKTLPSLWDDVVNFLRVAQPFPGTNISTEKAA